MKKHYTKPRVIDLSGLGVVGYESRALCMGGHEPASSATCADGQDVTQIEDVCAPNGMSTDLGNCNYGGNAANACIGLGSIN